MQTCKNFMDQRELIFIIQVYKIIKELLHW